MITAVSDSRHSSRKFLLALFLVTTGIYCHSQSVDRIKIEPDRDTLYPNMYSPKGNSGIISPYTHLNLTSAFEDKSANATIGIKGKKCIASISIKQSFAEKPKKVTLLSLEGLGKGTAAQFAYQYTLWNPSADFNHFDSIRNAYADRIKIPRDSINKRRSITYQDLDELAKDQLLNDHTVHWKHPLIFGISFSLDKTTFDYISDSASITPLQKDGINENFRFTFGTILSPSRILVLSYLYQDKYDYSEDPVNYFFPVGTNGAAFSKDVLIGSPHKKADNRIILEYRRTFFNKQANPSLALNPSISYLFNKKLIAFSFPVYFINYTKDNQVKGLQGGFELGILSKTDPLFTFSGFTAALFIAEPFDLYGLFKSK